MVSKDLSTKKSRNKFETPKSKHKQQRVSSSDPSDDDFGMDPSEFDEHVSQVNGSIQHTKNTDKAILMPGGGNSSIERDS